MPRLPTLLTLSQDLSWLSPTFARRLSILTGRILDAVITIADAADEVAFEAIHVLAEVESALVTHCPIEAEARRDAERMEREIAKREAARRLEIN